MDETVTPALASLQVVLDGVPETPGSFVWTSSTAFQLGISGFAGATLVVKLLVRDSGLRSLGGSIARAPQSVIAFP